jgi:hypothetical protein
MTFFVAQLATAYSGGRVAAGRCNGRPRQVQRLTVPLQYSILLAYNVVAANT